MSGRSGLVLLAVLLPACVGPSIRRHEVQPLVVDAGSRARPEVLNLLVYVPPGYEQDSSKANWPMVVYLHGIFVEGRNANFMTRTGLPAMIEQGMSPPFFVVFPQLRSFAARWKPRHFRALLAHMHARYRIDPARVHVTGVSLGASSGWDVVKACGESIASFVPVEGWGSPRGVARMRDVPVWAFFGPLDPFAPPGLAARAAKAHAAVGGRTRLTILKGASHWVQERVYGSKALWDWWAVQRKVAAPAPTPPCPSPTCPCPSPPSPSPPSPQGSTGNK